MKITKYPQSCLLIESQGTRIIIDPGRFVAEKYTPQSFGQINAVLLTHEHSDHADPGFIASLKSDATKVYGNRSTKVVLGDIVTDLANDGQTIDVGALKVEIRDIPHVDLPDGSSGPQNTGYIIDGMLLHPGDGVKTDDMGIQALVGAIPIAGPDVSTRDAFDMGKSLGCRIVIPIHYDYFTANPVTVAEIARERNMPFQIVPLSEGESYDTDDLAA